MSFEYTQWQYMASVGSAFGAMQTYKRVATSAVKGPFLLWGEGVYVVELCCLWIGST